MDLYREKGACSQSDRVCWHEERAEQFALLTVKAKNQLKNCYKFMV